MYFKQTLQYIKDTNNKHSLYSFIPSQLMEVGLVGVAGVLGESVMDHRVLGSKRD